MQRLDLSLALDRVLGDLTRRHPSDPVGYDDFLRHRALLLDRAWPSACPEPFASSAFEIAKKSAGVRPLCLMHPLDEARYQAAVQATDDVVEATLGPRVYSARLWGMRDQWLEPPLRGWQRLQREMRRVYAAGARSLLRLDAKDQFATTDTGLLLDALQDRGVSHRCLYILGRILSSTQEVCPGLPQGPTASYRLGTFSLIHVDEWLDSLGVDHWNRFVDDVRVLFSGGLNLELMIKEARARFQVSGTELSEEKIEMLDEEALAVYLRTSPRTLHIYGVEPDTAVSDHIKSLFQDKIHWVDGAREGLGILVAELMKTGSREARRYVMGHLEDAGIASINLAHFLETTGPMDDSEMSKAMEFLLEPTGSGGESVRVGLLEAIVSQGDGGRTEANLCLALAQLESVPEQSRAWAATAVGNMSETRSVKELRDFIGDLAETLHWRVLRGGLIGLARSGMGVGELIANRIRRARREEVAVTLAYLDI